MSNEGNEGAGDILNVSSIIRRISSFYKLGRMV